MIELTPEQKMAVSMIEGNIACIASAGSGKTASFTTRIANMIKNHGISPYNILAITFTKKASEEIKKRLSKLIGKDNANRVAIGTFHSIAYRILKILDRDFNRYHIVPDWWKMSKLNDICKERSEKNHIGLNLGIRAGELSQFISYQKANMIKPTDDLIIDKRVSFVEHVPEPLLREAYDLYERLKNEARMVDFDDILFKMYDKLLYDKDFRNKLSNQYKYIMVDEFQDTSTIVLEIIKLINDKNVFVVGDFRQSIYSFINANVENILNFKDEFKDVKVIELNKNFRSNKNIVQLSNDIISLSSIEKYKEYKPSESILDDGDKVKFTLYIDERKQFQDIADQIDYYYQNGHPLNEIAILVRTNSMTAIIEDILAERNIPYDISRTQSFFDRKEILDLLSYARLVVNTDDDISFRRIINTPNRYLGKQFVEELERFSGAHNMSLLQALRIFPLGDDWKYKRGIDSFIKVIEDLHFQANSDVNAGKFLRNIIKSIRYIEYLNETTMNPTTLNERINAIDKLCSIGSKFPNIKAFLTHVNIIKDKQNKSRGQDAVQIMTIHASKGLEFDTVFVPNINDNLLPHHMNNDIEEERRLFYVACSRARKNLFLSFYFYDEDFTVIKESQFVTELLGKDQVQKMKKDLFYGEIKSTFAYSSLN